MKNKFLWAIPLGDEQSADILQNAIISFDANILLDLHRLHKSGVEELKKAISLCENRAWLTHQAAYEYIKDYRIVDNVAPCFFESYHSELSNLEEKINDIHNKFWSKNSTKNEYLISKFDEAKNKIIETIQYLRENCTKEICTLKNDT